MTKGWWIAIGIGGVLIVGLCIGLGTLLFFGVFTLTQPVVDASEQFLDLVGRGKIPEAYAATATGFRAQLPRRTSRLL